jgi:bla regulator protein BlaR1
MIPESLSPIANHLWQCTLFAGLACLLTLALRKNSARVRYWVWVFASMKFLIPLSLLMAIGGRLEWRTAPVIAPDLSLVMQQVSQPFAATTVSSTVLVTVPPAPSPLSPILFGVWACGFIGISISWFLRLRRITAAVRAGSPIQLGLRIRVVSSPSFLEPGVFGVFRQFLLLPDGILDHLSPEQLKSVVAHELCHARHRDNLMAVVQMFIEAVFWFHPLVWWIGDRIFQERERACDQEVLRLGNEPRTYAEGILKVCELYLESPVACVAGVSGSNVRKRIQQIMSHQIGLRLTFAWKVVLATVAVAALTVPIAVGILNATAVHAQSPAQTAPAGPKFAVASIKPAAPDSEHFMFGVRPMPGGGINAPNVTLRLLIQVAYGLQDFQVSGGQGWIETARYNIEAKPDSPMGPNAWKEMLKDLLTDRFQLAFHRETRELPVYALVLAKKDGKLGPGMVESKEGGCAARDPSKPLGPPTPGQLPFCGNVLGGASQLTGTAATVGDIIPMLSRSLGRKVIDQTGLTGKYDITLKYTPDENQLATMAPPGEPRRPAPVDAPGPSLFSALQEELGLKLAPQKAPVEVFVIDRAVKPSEN